MGRIQWTNKAFHRLCGHSAEEVIGQKPAQFLQGEKTDPATVKKISDAIKAAKCVEVEILNYHKNGSTYWANLFISPIMNREDELKGFVAFVKEVTPSNRRRLAFMPGL